MTTKRDLERDTMRPGRADTIRQEVTPAPWAEKAVADVRHELVRAVVRFPHFNGAHEGYAVILEELDELWDEIKGDADKSRMRAEAVQVAAMAVRFVIDVCDDGTVARPCRKCFPKERAT